MKEVHRPPRPRRHAVSAARKRFPSGNVGTGVCRPRFRKRFSMLGMITDDRVARFVIKLWPCEEQVSFELCARTRKPHSRTEFTEGFSFILLCALRAARLGGNQLHGQWRRDYFLESAPLAARRLCRTPWPLSSRPESPGRKMMNHWRSLSVCHQIVSEMTYV